MTHDMWIILAMALTVFAVRSVAFIFARHIALPRFIRETLELLPPAILTVIVASGALLNKQGTALHIAFDNHYLLACIVTILIAIKVKNFLAVIILGYMAFLLITYLLG